MLDFFRHMGQTSAAVIAVLLVLSVFVAGLRRQRVLSPLMLAAAICIIFFRIIGCARLAGYWHTNLPEAMYFELIPRAGEFAHPR